MPSILDRIRRVSGGHWDSRQAPTQERSLEVAESEFAEVGDELTKLLETDLPALEAELEAAGAAWTPGRKLPRR